jgi:hypothetical protein
VPEKSILEQHPYLTQPFKHFENLTPLVAQPDTSLETDFPKKVDDTSVSQETVDDSKKKTKYIIKQQNQQVKKTKE